jgi:hypothetical protein
MATVAINMTAQWCFVARRRAHTLVPAWPVCCAPVFAQGGGAAWKEGGVFSGAPAWVTTLMRANFRTPQGALVVGDMTALLP